MELEGKEIRLSYTFVGLLTIAFFAALLAMVGPFIQGCCFNTPPTDPNSDPNDLWTLYHSGTISKIDFFEGEGNEKYYWNSQFTFDDGMVIKMDRLESKHHPKIGEFGHLFVDSRYKDNNHSQIQNGDFKWIRMIPVEPEPKILSVKVAPEKQQKETMNNSWKNPSIKMPIYGQPVIAKLKDGSFAMVYLNKKEEWKLDVNKNKISGGMSIRNVVEWKEVELD